MLHHKNAFRFFVLLITCRLHGAEFKVITTATAQKLNHTLAVAQECARFASAPPSKIQVVEYTPSEKERAWAELAEVLRPFLDDDMKTNN